MWPILGIKHYENNKTENNKLSIFNYFEKKYSREKNIKKKLILFLRVIG